MAKARLTGVLDLNNKPFIQGMNQAVATAKRSGTGISNAFKAVGGSLSGIATGGGLAALATGAVMGAAKMETLSTAFEVLIGDAGRAGTLLKEISSFAASTPFELPELANASRSLLAFGVNSEAIIPKLRAIGDIASGIGQPIGELAELYGKAKVQGRLFAEDVNQLTGRGIPIIQEFAQQFGVTESEVKKLVETGQVGFGNLEMAFESLTGAGGRFFGMMERQSQTFEGKLSSLKDAFAELSRAAGGGLLPALKERMDILSAIMGGGGFESADTSFFSRMADLFTGAAITTGPADAIAGREAMKDRESKLAQMGTGNEQRTLADFNRDFSERERLAKLNADMAANATREWEELHKKNIEEAAEVTRKAVAESVTNTQQMKAAAVMAVTSVATHRGALSTGGLRDGGLNEGAYHKIRRGDAKRAKAEKSQLEKDMARAADNTAALAKAWGEPGK